MVTYFSRWGSAAVGLGVFGEAGSSRRWGQVRRLGGSGDASCYLSRSVGHRLLQSPARNRVHVRGAGHPEHRRAAEAADRLAESAFHQGDQR